MSPQSFLLNDTTLNTLNTTINGEYSQATNGTGVALIGSHFQNPLFVAPIVINAIAAAAFLVLIVYSWVRQQDEKESRTAFIVMMSLLVGMTLSFLRSFADGMAHEYTPQVPSVFLILPALKPVINNTLDITIIGVIYRIIQNRNQWLVGNRKGYKTWQMIHEGAVLLLAILGLADTAFYIYAQVLLFTQDSVDQTQFVAANRYQDIHLTYTTYYLALSIEILACVVYLFIQSRRQNLRSRILTHLATSISPPLILRSAIVLAAAVRFSFQTYSESRVLSVVAIALWDFPSVVIFTGLVLVQFSKGWAPEPVYDTMPANIQVVGVGPTWTSPQQLGQYWKAPVVRHRYDNSM